MVILKVFVGSTEVETITESMAMNFAALLGGVGGNAGLTIGVSFMTVMEWAEFIVTAIMVYFVYQHKVGAERGALDRVEQICHEVCG